MITADDTDVFLLMLAHAQYIEIPMYQRFTSKGKINIINVSEIAQTLGDDLCTSTLGLHAYLGCDTVSAFASRGKISGFKLLTKNRNFMETFKALGTHWHLTEELSKELEHFTCYLYCSSTKTKSVNELRYQLFCAKRGEIESFQLPPCQDALKKHMERANYQSAIWRRATLTNAETPSPEGKGWKLETCDNKKVLRIDWMDGQPAPKSVLDLIACNCSKVCKEGKCECITYGMKCTDMCKLSDCDNQSNAENESDVEEGFEAYDDIILDDDYY